MVDAAAQVVLFSDDFSSYPPGEKLDADYFARLRGEGRGARREERLGPWSQTTLHYSWRSERIKGYRACALPWRLVDSDGKRWLEQPESFFNVMLAAGDPGWSCYALELDLAMMNGPAGPVVRYRTSRQNYWVSFETGRPVRLVRRDQDEHVTLAAARGPLVERGRVYHCRVACDGPRIAVAVDGETVISVEDDTYAMGGIALRTEGPSRFADVRVWTSPEEASALECRARRLDPAHPTAARARPEAPKVKLLHELELPPGTTVLHLRDVNDDGRLEAVCCEVAVPKLDYIRLARITVLDWEGNELWSAGESMEGAYAVHGAFAFNTADIDGDGRTEIIATRDFEIAVLDGATGEVKKRRPTPHAFKGREDLYERTVGDSILVCNLRGLDTPRDIVLKDRYLNLWAFTGDLEPLWHRHLNTGHYPRARDVDGDGRDEVMGGYSLLGHDGHTRWVVPGADPDYNRSRETEHVDSVLIEGFGPEEDSPIQIAMAASDFGFLLLDVDGRIRAHHRIGHAQSLGAARFRPDLPGRQFVVRTAWGNRDIMNMFDCEGRLLLTREIPGSGTVPVNWLGDGSALLRFGGCLADGNFEPAVELPGGGGGSPAAYDVNGDGVDEVFVRRGATLSVYGPESVPTSPARAPRRELTNWNNYGGHYL